MSTKEDKEKPTDAAETATPFDRRKFIQGGAAVAAAVSLGGITQIANAQVPGNKVAIIGGGVAGLTAAHELATRGYSVTVYERRELGGKARSTQVPNTATGGRKDLPGEHGFRIIPNFYFNLPDTLKRIPVIGKTKGARDNLTSPRYLKLALTNQPDILLILVITPVRYSQ